MTLCLVLGGSGFLGSYVAEALVQSDYQVRIFGDFRSGTRNITAIRDRVELVRGDFLKISDLKRAMEGVDLLFHYISTTNPLSSHDNTVFDMETNVIGSIRMMELAVKCGIREIIFPSSGGTIYGEPEKLPIAENAPTNPLNPYAISKLTIENYLKYFSDQYGLHYLILRYSNPYGERQNPRGNQGVIPIFLNNIRKGKAPCVIGDGNSVRDYIYVNDAIDATISLLEKRSHDEIFNIGSGEGISLNQLLGIMSEITGKRIVPLYAHENKKYLNRIVLDITKIRNLTGWSPKTDIRTGVTNVWHWLKEWNE